MPTVSSLRVELAVDDRGFQAGLKRAEQRQEQFAQNLRKTGERAGRSFSEGFAQAAKLTGAGSALTAGLTVPIVGIATASLKAASDLDTMKRSLTAVAGGTREAEVQLARLRDVARAPGLSFQEAVQGSVRLQSVGFSAKEAERALSAVGNAVASTGGGAQELQGVIVALTQIEGKGKVSAEEINQIAERFPKIRQLMKDAFGTADTEALQKMEIDSKTFINAIVREMEKLPKVAGGAKNGFDNLADTANQSLARIGTGALRLLVPVMDRAAGTIEGLTDALMGLPGPLKAVLATLGGGAAVLGPLVLGIGAFSHGMKETAEGAKILSGMGKKLISFFTGVAVETGTATTARAAYTASVATNTGAVATNTGALGANSGALGGNAGAAGMAARMRGVGGVGVLGRLGVAGAVLAASVAIPHFGGNWKDQQEGKAPVSFGDTASHLNPWRKDDPNIGRGMSRADRIAGLAGMGETPRQAILRQQREAGESFKAGAAVDQEELRKAEDARWQAQIDGARSVLAAVPDQERAQAELKAVLPLIQQRQEALAKRAAELKPMIEKSAKDAATYWGIQSDQAGLTEQAEAMKAQVAQEAKQRQEQAAQAARELSETQFSIVLAQARHLISDGPDETRAQDEAETVVPVLKNRMGQLAQQARSLWADAQKGGEKALDYWRVVNEGWAVRGQIDSILKSAAQEEAASIEKADKEAKELFDAQNKAASAEFKAMVAGFPEEQRARMEAAEGIAGAKQQQAEMLENLRHMAPDSKMYHQQLAEYWQSEADVKQMERAAKREEMNARKKAQDEQRQLTDAQSQLSELRIQGNPFLNDKQRKAALFGVKSEQYGRLLRPVEGESRLEATRRMVEAQQLKNSILGDMGAGKGIRTAGGGMVGAGGKSLAAAWQHLSAMEGNPLMAGAQGGGGRIFTTPSGRGYTYPGSRLAPAVPREAEQAAQRYGGTTVYQVIVTGETPTERKQSVRRQMDQLSKVM